MRIVLITPDGPTKRTGNRVASVRWARILRRLGHRVRIASRYDDRPADLMVAIHAWRSAGAIERFKARCPASPVVLQLSGTDIYEYLRSDPGPTPRAMALADRLIGLNDLAFKAVPRGLRKRLRIIHQSAEPPNQARRPGESAIVDMSGRHLVRQGLQTPHVRSKDLPPWAIAEVNADSKSPSLAA